MYVEPITLPTPRDYAKFLAKVPSKECRATRKYFSIDGSAVFEYDNEYDRDYDYMLYTQPIVWDVM